MKRKNPKVSIGMPVFNGEQYISQAIDSILCQTFQDFEFIIFDNASTDLTQHICESFAERDDRIRYFRNAENLGAGPNYNLCFYESTGEYFKWAAHDDMIRSDFLEATIGLMDSSREAVLCVYKIHQVGKHGQTLEMLDLDATDLMSEKPAHRFVAVFRPLIFHYFFGLFRRESMVGSQLHGDYIGSDIIFLAEMALRGPFVKCDEPIYINRRHANRYTVNDLKNREQAIAWLNTGKSRRKALRKLSSVRAMFSVVHRNVADKGDRLECYRFIWKYISNKRIRKKLMKDLIWACSPEISRMIFPIKGSQVD